MGLALHVQAAPRPNIIVIMSDDMGYSDLGCYGGEMETPNLDGLAHNGLRFTQFYNTARCCPTRASLLTGLHPHQAGMGHMVGKDYLVQGKPLAGYGSELNESCVTIAEVLRPSGYATYAVGKWHVAKINCVDDSEKKNWPLHRGFDRYYGIIGGAANFFEPVTLVRNDTPISYLNDSEYQPDEEYYFTDAISDHAVRYVREHAKDQSNKPFFMYVAYTAAHWPMHARARDVAKYKNKYDSGYAPVRQARYERMLQMDLIDPRWKLTPQADEWDVVKDKEWESTCMEVYAAMINSMDQGIGRIVAALKETNRFEDTVILFLQDNGACAENTGRQSRKDYPRRVDKPVYEPYAPEHIVFSRQGRTRDGYPVIEGPLVLPGPRDTFIAYGRGWANVSNTPFREYKHWVHEGGISTPLIMHAPALTADSMKGAFYRECGQLTDLMTTCVDLAGAEYPKRRNGIDIPAMEGTSLRPALSGKSLGRTRPLFWEHEGNRAMRDGKWKLVAKGPKAGWELYDIEADRSEMNDLAETFPDRVQEMKEQWNNWAKSCQVLPWPWANESLQAK